MPTQNLEDTFQRLQEDTAKAIINNIAIEQCLQSSTILDVMSDKNQTDLQEYDQIFYIKKKIYLFANNNI